MVRAPFYDENGVKRGAWSEDEDDRLRDYIQKCGHSNWRELPKFAGLSRCGKSCRLRWVNYLKPNLKKGNYTKEEEDTITRLHDDFGNKWPVIAAQLPGRTDNEIKNYWHTHLKNRRKKNKNTNNENQNSNSASEHESDKSRGSESDAESILALIPLNHILESSSFYPETSYLQTPQCSPLSPETSSGTNRSSCSKSVHVPETEHVPEETIVTSLDSYGQSSGDFWTEPFVPDNSHFPNYEYPLAFTDGEYLSQYVSYIGDTVDSLYQAIQELPEDSAYIPPSYL